MQNDLFKTRNLFENHAESGLEADKEGSGSMSETPTLKNVRRPDPLVAWRNIQASSIEKLYHNDPLIREAINLQATREKHPGIQSSPPSESIIGYTEGGQLYAKRAARTDAERLEMMAAIRKTYDE